MENATTAIFRDVSGKMHDGILFDCRLPWQGGEKEREEGKRSRWGQWRVTNRRKVKRAINNNNYSSSPNGL